MPTVDVDFDELRELTGHEEKSDDELEWDLFNLGVEYEGETEDGKAKLEFESDRLDRLSVEGLARSLRYQYGDARGVSVPRTNDPEWVIEVDESVPEERPYVTGAIVRGLSMDEGKLESLIQLQEKLHRTMGRKRAKGAIGVHDLTMLKGRAAVTATEGANGAESDPRAGAASAPPKTITYRGIAPDGDRFVPLDDDADRTPGEVIEEHPTGRTYGPLLADYEAYPAIYDDIGLFSFPPVINGRRTEVDEGTRDVFIELTGTDQWTIDKMCTIICYALAARGGRVESVRVEYPDGELVRPDLAVEHKRVTHERVEHLLGVGFEREEVVDLLERSGLAADVEESADGVVYDVSVPPYRTDVLHPVDVVDDVGRAYGFNDLDPRYPDVGTIGGRTAGTRLEDAARDVLVGLGFEDMLNFHLANEAACFDRMRLDPEGGAYGAAPPATIGEPYSEDFTVVRTWALPSLMMVLENNTHRAYPQDLAEIGLSARVDEREETKVHERRTVAAVLARTDAGYEAAKARLQALAAAFDCELETPATDHPSFIPGRTAAVVLDGESVGVVGEVHPAVLVEHDLEVPVAAFEFDLRTLE
ncbi:phenylalanine--tRNA ligase subunit beta [Halomarina ordinaria]|uniref:Phenylalanine--tRNA ligase beta subunit n=1 Tax=Halomarina ordinaria TaxID=3033939 RepID=A0ABD5UBP0_9EURY|nr:phenylalanine--tRNA ligase subunit beta [Halomarina sp. PSRA2]